MESSSGSSQVYLDPDIGSIVVGVPLVSDYVMLRYDVYRRVLAMQGFDDVPTSCPIGSIVAPNTGKSPRFQDRFELVRDDYDNL